MDIYESSFCVTSYHCDATTFLRPDAFLHHCQEAAELHAQLHDFGYDWGMEKGLIWVMKQADVLIHRRPRWKQAVVLRTSTGTINALQARRWVKLYAADSEELLIEAELQWLLIDLRRRRPCSFKKAGIDIETLDSCYPATVPEGEWIASSQPATAYTTGWRDEDFHGHVNNASYLIWILNALPEISKSLKQFRIDFHKESVAGEDLTIHHEEHGTCSSEFWSRHRIVDSSGNSRAEIICRCAKNILATASES